MSWNPPPYPLPDAVGIQTRWFIGQSGLTCDLIFFSQHLYQCEFKNGGEVALEMSYKSCWIVPELSVAFFGHYILNFVRLCSFLWFNYLWFILPFLIRFVLSFLPGCSPMLPLSPPWYIGYSNKINVNSYAVALPFIQLIIVEHHYVLGT